ncbi:MAG: hypothetical protein ABI725_02285 [Chloroflexota bacterium]
MRIFVSLPSTTWDELYELSTRELRNPRDQAALLIVDGLRRDRIARQSGTKRLASAERDESGRFIASGSSDGKEPGG